MEYTDYHQIKYFKKFGLTRRIERGEKKAKVKDKICEYLITAHFLESAWSGPGAGAGSKKMLRQLL